MLPKRFFLFIGYFRYYKGLHIALNAVKNTKINLVLAGDGEIKKNLLNKIKEENIHNITNCLNFPLVHVKLKTQSFHQTFPLLKTPQVYGELN